MSLPSHPIPAPGFKLVSGKRGPRNKETKFMVQFRNGYIDDKHSYSGDQLRWIHNGSDWDVVAIRDVAVKIEAGAWTPKSGGY